MYPTSSSASAGCCTAASAMRLSPASPITLSRTLSARSESFAFTAAAMYSAESSISPQPCKRQAAVGGSGLMPQRASFSFSFRSSCAGAGAGKETPPARLDLEDPKPRRLHDPVQHRLEALRVEIARDEVHGARVRRVPERAHQRGRGVRAQDAPDLQPPAAKPRAPEMRLSAVTYETCIERASALVPAKKDLQGIGAQDAPHADGLRVQQVEDRGVDVRDLHIHLKHLRMTAIILHICLSSGVAPGGERREGMPDTSRGEDGR